MLINSVILVLQETLEAALLISVLMAISYQRAQKNSWLLFSLCGGVLFSFLYAMKMEQISEWFDYVGQEVTNALFHILIAFFISVYSWNLFGAQQPSSCSAKIRFLNSLCAVSIVTLAIAREGSEILLYLGGFLQQDEHLQAVLVGGSIGFGIGISIGVLLFYTLAGLPRYWWQPASLILLALFSGNMLSQAVLQLTQADWISATQGVWDTSAWLPENSISGQLLYALVGYEATPSFVQVISYLAGVAIVLTAALVGKKLLSTPFATNNQYF